MKDQLYAKNLDFGIPIFAATLTLLKKFDDISIPPGPTALSIVVPTKLTCPLCKNLYPAVKRRYNGEFFDKCARSSETRLSPRPPTQLKPRSRKPKRSSLLQVLTLTQRRPLLNLLHQLLTISLSTCTIMLYPPPLPSSTPTHLLETCLSPS